MGSDLRRKLCYVGTDLWRNPRTYSIVNVHLPWPLFFAPHSFYISNILYRITVFLPKVCPLVFSFRVFVSDELIIFIFMEYLFILSLFLIKRNFHCLYNSGLARDFFSAHRRYIYVYVCIYICITVVLASFVCCRKSAVGLAVLLWRQFFLSFFLAAFKIFLFIFSFLPFHYDVSKYVLLTLLRIWWVSWISR